MRAHHSASSDRRETVMPASTQICRPSGEASAVSATMKGAGPGSARILRVASSPSSTGMWTSMRMMS
jgi:hypothetical protein